MDPSTLDMLLLLRVYMHMCSEETLQNIIDRNKAIARGAAIDRRRSAKAILLTYTVVGDW